MPLITTEAYLAERHAIAAHAARLRAMAPAELRDHIAFDAGRRLRQKFTGQAVGAAVSRRAAAVDGAPALGLVFNATSVNDTSVAQRPLREKFKIDRDASRCKRMKVGVSNAARLIHRQAHQERHAQRWNLKFLTLTYRRVEDWRPGHMATFRKALWHWCRANGCKLRCVWVAELQARGALHYHMVVWLPKGKFLPAPDKGKHHVWWPHGSTNVQTAQSPVGYLVKYASKATAALAAQYPRGARMFGHAGLTSDAREEVRYWRAPMWVRDAMPGTADIRKVQGGYCNKHTGEFLASPWRVCVGQGGEVWAYRIDQPETVQ